MQEQKYSYTVVGFLSVRRGPPIKVVVEWFNGIAVNQYRGYERGDLLVLYPQKTLKWIGIQPTKKTISIRDTRRDY